MNQLHGCSDDLENLNSGGLFGRYARSTATPLGEIDILDLMSVFGQDDGDVFGIRFILDKIDQGDLFQGLDCWLEVLLCTVKPVFWTLHPELRAETVSCLLQNETKIPDNYLEDALVFIYPELSRD